MVKTFLRFFLRHPFLKKHYTCDDSTTTPVLTALLFIVLALVALVLTALVLLLLVLMALMLVMSSSGADFMSDNIICANGRLQ